MEPETLGRIVREAWVKYCQDTGHTANPAHLAPWDELGAWDKGADIAIGEAVAAALRKRRGGPRYKGMQQGAPDDFQTPPIALTPLLPYLKPGWRIWEPACGKGYLVDGLRAAGFSVIASDINPRAAGSLQQSFYSWEPPDGFDCIITNPPFSGNNKQRFLHRCIELGKPWALLMPLTSLEGIKRQQIYRRYPIQVVVLDRRIHFETPNMVANSRAWMATEWFTCGLGLPERLNFFTLEPDKAAQGLLF